MRGSIRFINIRSRNVDVFYTRIPNRVNLGNSMHYACMHSCVTIPAYAPLSWMLRIGIGIPLGFALFDSSLLLLLSLSL